jgi:hypothetical protein
MKIILCASIAFNQRMIEVEEELKKFGHEVVRPIEFVKDAAGKEITTAEFYTIRHSAGADANWVWKQKAMAMHEHFEKVVWAEAILVVNEEKNSIPGYVGANTLMEMALAFHLQKPIFLLRAIPEMSYSEEIRGMLPIVLDGDLTQIPAGREALVPVS